MQQRKITPKNIESDNWWQQFDHDKLDKYLLTHNWIKIEIPQEKRIWWLYQNSSHYLGHSRTAYNLPCELLNYDYQRLIAITKKENKHFSDYKKYMKESLQDIADITGNWLIDILEESQK